MVASSLRFVATIAAAALLPTPASAGSAVRYAIVVGNNRGVAPGEDLPDLAHAESEARRIKDKLIAVGNFDAARVVLLQGRGRAAILQAARGLAAQHRRDRRELGRVATLFAFFYTGHGLRGRLLTADEPLAAADLAGIFKEMGATFTVALFDACFSGSLDLQTLRAKGIRPTPGFNAFTDLPREVLNTEGTMWFVSSRPDQVSYEDSKVGGVFSHYFVEGMERARTDGIGVTLDDIWEYARVRTLQHTDRSGRQQTPQKMVRNLTASSPLYFSFPARRSAVLAFAPSVEGRFLIRYESGQLVEVVTKRPGQSLRVPAYPAEVVLERLEGKKGEQRLRLQPGQAVLVESQARWTAKGASRLGSRLETLKAKGSLDDLVLASSVRRWSGLVDLVYRASFGRELSAAATHNLGAGFRADHGPFFGAIAVGWGRSAGSYEAWGYTLNRTDVRLEAGAAVDLFAVRLGLAADAALVLRDVAYRDGAGRLAAGCALGGSASLLYSPLSRLPLFLALRGGLAAEYAPAIVPVAAPREWRPVPWLAVGLAVRVF